MTPSRSLAAPFASSLAASALAALALAACSQGNPGADARTDPDAPAAADAAEPADAAPGPDAPPTPDAPPGAYRHTIVVDGVDDFFAGEAFATTSSPAYTAYVTWDDDNIYFGYQGPDIDVGAPESANKWVHIYLDIDPGGGSSALVGETYNTQQPAFPAGFGAEHYLRWKSDDSFEGVQSYDPGTDTWRSLSIPMNAAVQGDFVEMSIARNALGAPTQVGVAALMINETPLAEAAFAGLYADNFADGYHPSVPMTAYLRIDFASGAAPVDPANRAP